MAEVRAVVQLNEDEYASLVKDITDVLENEKDAAERDRKLRMLLQHRGFMTSGYDDNWKVPAGPVTPGLEAKKAAKTGKTRKATKAKKATR